MISAHAFILVGLAFSALTWAIVLLGHGRFSPRRRAGVVLTLALAQPFVTQLVGTRTATQVGAVSELSHTWSLVARGANLTMVVVAATLLVAPGAPVGRGGRVLIGGVWSLAAALFVADIYSPGSGSVQYAFYFAAALTAVVLGVPDRTTLLRWLRRATRAVVAVSLGATLVAPSWAFIGEGARGYDRTLFGLPRLTGLSPHPNALAAIAVVALLLEAGFAGGARWARWAAGSAALTCLLLTQSNTGYIAAAFGAVAVVAVRRPAYRYPLVAASIAFLALYTVWPAAVVPSALRGNDYVSSVSGRATIWQIALGEWEQHPLTGYGPGLFSPSYVSTHFPANLQVTNGHNQVVQTLADSGLLGAAALLFVFVATAACAWRARRVDGGLSIALVASFWIFGITETPMRVVGVVALPALATLGIALLTSREALAAVTAGVAQRPALRPRLSEAAT